MTEVTGSTDDIIDKNIEIIDCDDPKLASKTIEEIKQKVEKTENDDKIKILWMSDKWDMNTGFAKCAREFLHRIAQDTNKFVVIHIPKYTERPVENIYQMTYQDRRYAFGIIPPNCRKNDQVINTLPQILNSLKPDFFVVQDDHFVMTRDNLHSIAMPKETLFICYVASDGSTIATAGMQALDKVDYIVPMTGYGKEVMNKGGFKNKTVDPIYHGVNIDLWRPLPDVESKLKLKKIVSEFFSRGYNKEINFADKFVVYMGGRNSPRKNHSRGIEAFAKFAKGKEDVTLLIHAIGFNATDYNLPDYVERIIPLILGDEYKNTKDKVIFTPPVTFDEGFSEQQMIQLMQIADCYLSSSNGEGAGLFLYESCATGIPVVSNDFTTPREILINPILTEEGIAGPRGLLAKIKTEMHVGMGVVHGLMDIDHAAEQLEVLYQDWKNGSPLAKEMSKNGVMFAKQHTWDIESNKWKQLFTKLKPSSNLVLTKIKVN